MIAPGRRHRVRAVAGDDVAERVFFRHHRLGGEGHAGRGRLDGCVVTTNWLAAAGLTTTLLDVAVNEPALVLKAMFIVSALLYDRPLNVATPLTSVTVKVLPCKLAVPSVPRAAVTVCVLSLVMMLPNGSSSATTGWVAKATPAVAVARRLRRHHQLAGRRRADHHVAGCGRERRRRWC